MKEIFLTQGKIALVDDADYPALMEHLWTAREDRNTWYAFRSVRYPDGTRGSVDMQREIMGLQRGDKRVVDHIDHNGLNNQRQNLRAITLQQNSCKFTRALPPSGYRGVCWDKATSKWLATIRVDGRKRIIGRFLCPIEAARAYDAEVLKVRGEFGVTNEMLGAYQGRCSHA